MMNYFETLCRRHVEFIYMKKTEYLNNDQMSIDLLNYILFTLSRYSQDTCVQFFSFLRRNAERKRTSYVVRCSRLRARSCSF
jgi:hypothetical protein